MGVLYRTPLFVLHLKRKINMAFSLYDALDKSRGFIKSFDCKLPLGNNTTIIVDSVKASGYEISITRNKKMKPERIYGSRYDFTLPDDLVKRADMVVYLILLGLRDYFAMVNDVVGKIEEAMINGIRIGRHPKTSITEILNKFDEINDKFGFMTSYMAISVVVLKAILKKYIIRLWKVILVFIIHSFIETLSSERLVAGVRIRSSMLISASLIHQEVKKTTTSISP